MDTMTKRETLTAGDILHCGWGSDMSINDYYEVTRVTPSGKTASTTTGSTPAPSASSRPTGTAKNPSKRTTCAPCSGRAAPSGHWCEKSTACPHPRKNTETVEKDKPQPENITIL